MGLPIVFRGPSGRPPRQPAQSIPYDAEPDPGRELPRPTDEDVLSFAQDVVARGIELDPRIVASHFKNAGYEAGIHEMGEAIRRLRGEGRIQ